MNNYILSYDASAPIVQRQLDAFIAGNKYVAKWSFLFSGCYFIKSEYDIDDFIKNFSDFFSDGRFIVAKLETDSNDVVNGKLSPEIWRWLNGMSEEEYRKTMVQYKEKWLNKD
ncbi:hypothetical protein [Sphingomonas sp.]|uniref:hypothetical protein n=1 Tax=Sphingomonas sp. TaxID=28214 RepID=UPI002ED7CC30